MKAELQNKNTPDRLIFEDNSGRIDRLKRCTRCILPETMPFIEFDEQGVCNYCRNYRKTALKPAEALHAIADRIRKSDGSCDCI